MEAVKITTVIVILAL